MKNSIFQCKLTRCTQLRDFLLVRATSVLGVLASHRPRAFGKAFGIGLDGVDLVVNGSDVIRYHRSLWRGRNTLLAPFHIPPGFRGNPVRGRPHHS